MWHRSSKRVLPRERVVRHIKMYKVGWMLSELVRLTHCIVPIKLRLKVDIDEETNYVPLHIRSVRFFKCFSCHSR